MRKESTSWIAEDRLHIVVRSEVPPVYNTRGQLVSPKKRRVYAQFTRLVAPLWAREHEAAKALKMATRPENMTRDNWLCFYNLEGDVQQNGWDEEEQAAIVERLGTAANVFRVEKPRIPAPWPAYDKLAAVGRRTVTMVAEKIAETVKELELDPALVVAYERDNQDRPEVIAAVEQLGAEEETEDEPLVAA